MECTTDREGRKVAPAIIEVRKHQLTEHKLPDKDKIHYRTTAYDLEIPRGAAYPNVVKVFSLGSFVLVKETPFAAVYMIKESRTFLEIRKP